MYAFTGMATVSLPGNPGNSFPGVPGVLAVQNQI